MRRIPILNIIPSTTVGIPSSIEVNTDLTTLFHGKEWINDTVTPVIRSPFYSYDNDTSTSTPVVPINTRLLTATTFEIVGNIKYAGKYTVYTAPSAAGLASSSFANAKTTIRVNEALAPIGSSSASLLTSGIITNISTYKFTVSGETDILLLEGVLNSTRPFDLVGRLSSGWGEVLQQNFLKNTQNFAGSVAPIAPIQGQLWFDTSTSALKIMPTANGTWLTIGFANGTGVTSGKYTHSQPSAGTTWTLSHNLNLPAPFVGLVQFFVNTGNGIKLSTPADVIFNSANQCIATFSTASSGIAIISGS